MYILKESGKSRRSPSSSELLPPKKSSSSSENTNACSSLLPLLDSLSLLFLLLPSIADCFLFFCRPFLSIFCIFIGSSTLILTGFPSLPKAPPTIIVGDPRLSFDWSVMHIAGPSVRSSGSLHDSGIWPSLSQRFMHRRQWNIGTPIEPGFQSMIFILGSY